MFPFFYNLIFFLNIFKFKIYDIKNNVIYFFTLQNHYHTQKSYTKHFFHKIILDSRLHLGSLGKMRTHISLQIEICKLIVFLKLQKCRQLGIGVDLATILLVLKIVGANILVDITGYLRACHLRTRRLLKELGKLITNSGRLDKSRRSAISSLSLALGILLLGRL